MIILFAAGLGVFLYYVLQWGGVAQEVALRVAVCVAALVNTVLNAEVPMIGRIDLEEGATVSVGGGVYFDDPVVLGFGQ